MTQKSINSEIMQNDEPYFHSTLIGTTVDFATDVFLANEDGPYPLAVPLGAVSHFSGTGLVVTATGMVAYFNFEAILKNIAGPDQNLNFVKLVTGGINHSDSFSHVITSFGGVNGLGELLELGQMSKNGTGTVSCELGFDFVTAKVTLLSAGNSFLVKVNGDVGKTLKWKISVAVNSIIL